MTGKELREEIPYSEKSYELQWLEAERELACLKWELASEYGWIEEKHD